MASESGVKPEVGPHPIHNRPSMVQTSWGILIFTTVARLSRSYVQIDSEGTRTIVRYKPSKDGPVSRRITLQNRIRWAYRILRKRPWDNQIKFKRREASRELNYLLSHPSQAKGRYNPGDTWGSRRAGTTPARSGTAAPLQRPVQRLQTPSVVSPNRDSNAPVNPGQVNPEYTPSAQSSLTPST